MTAASSIGRPTRLVDMAGGRPSGSDDERLCRMLVALSMTLTVGSLMATLVLGAGWLYLGLMDRDATVPSLLPILTLAAAAFSAAAGVQHEEIRVIGRRR